MKIKKMKTVAGEIQWKRGTFKIGINPRAGGAESDPGTRNGWVSPLFGLWRRHSGVYDVTHLASGLLCGESISNFRAAKQYCTALTTLNVDWAKTDPLRDVSEDVRMSIRELLCSRI